MKVLIGSARIDEHGEAHGGQAGDQTGGEVALQNWYLHKLGWRVLRPKDGRKAEKIAWCMRAACENPHIGYDQWQRDTLYEAARQVNFNCALVDQNVETDCSALVRVCLAYAGIGTPNFRTWDEAKVLLDTGEFDELRGDSYTLRADRLRTGDVLVTRSHGHTAVVVRGCGDSNEEEKEEDLMDLLKRGSKGAQVMTLQRLLNAILEAGLVVDGEFGPATERALREYQRMWNLEVDGICGRKSWEYILKKED